MTMFANKGGIRTATGAILVVLGAIVLGVSAPAVLQHQETIVNVMVSFSETKDGGSFASSFGGLFLVPIGGAIIVLSGLLALLGSVVANRIPFFLALLLAFIGGIVCLAGGAAFQSFDSLSDLDEVVIPNLTKLDLKISPTGNAYHQWGIAAFDACCFDKGWTSQSPKMSPCEPTPTCPALTDARVFLYEKLVDLSLLCSCIREPDAYTKTYNVIKASTLCDNLHESYVQIDAAMKIPTTPLTVDRILKEQYPKAKVIRKVRISGFNDLDPNEAEGESFGCGLGYYKGMHWMFKLFVTQTFTTVSSVGLALGAIVILFLSFILLVGYLQASDGYTTDADMKSSTLAPSSTGPTPTFGGPAPSMGGPAPSMGGASGSYTQQQIAERLREFYQKNDPTKTESDISNVAAYGAKNGIPALNAKLQEKYGKGISMD